MGKMGAYGVFIRYRPFDTRGGNIRSIRGAQLLLTSPLHFKAVIQILFDDQTR
jgi:hypothetical protein